MYFWGVGEIVQQARNLLCMLMRHPIFFLSPVNSDPWIKEPIIKPRAQMDVVLSLPNSSKEGLILYIYVSYCTNTHTHMKKG